MRGADGSRSSYLRSRLPLVVRIVVLLQSPPCSDASDTQGLRPLALAPCAAPRAGGYHVHLLDVRLDEDEGARQGWPS